MSQTALGIYLSYVDQTLLAQGEKSEEYFLEAGLDYPNYIQPAERVPLDVLNRLIKVVRRRAKSPHIFLLLGVNVPVMAHGNLGSAILASQDIDSALLLLERYAAIVMPAIKVSFHRTEQYTAMEYQVLTPFNDLNIALIEAIISTTSHNFSLLTGKSFYPQSLSVTYDEPGYSARYREFTQCDVTFNAPTNRFVFSHTALNLPITTANQINREFMVQQCESDLLSINSQTPLSDRIREIISLYLDESPSIQFVAQKLEVSERTLRRRLNEEGINYRELLKQIRQNMAEHYLKNTEMRIEHIAWQLGYKETANFRKAFKEHSGVSPRLWRQTHR
ncbi:MAG: AraC family transcriptional regulator [Pseudomonadales bacterium]|nr:AraC family transcriptional regulator [Pseudomonadales bacterium]